MDKSLTENVLRVGERGKKKKKKLKVTSTNTSKNRVLR